MLAHIKTNDNHWTVVIDGQPRQFDANHPEYSGLVDCVRTGDAEEFIRLMDVGNTIQNWSEDEFEFRDGHLYFEGEQVACESTKRVLEMLRSDFPHQPMLKYLRNLYQNVSRRAIQESYRWSSQKGLPITEDGMLLGYKGVAVHTGEPIMDLLGNTINEGDFVDKYTRVSYRNNVGDSPQMNRRSVNDDHTNGCAEGLHVGTFEYAKDLAGNGPVVLVKFNPKDIVSVPSDCNCQKMRVSEYTVIGVARGLVETPVYEYEEDDDLDDEDEWDDDWDDDEEEY